MAGRGGDDELGALRDEVARLRAENERLRGSYRVPADPPIDKSTPRPARPTRVVLLPDPATATEPGGLGPEALRGVVETLISILRERQPDIQWQAEHDLERVSLEAECFQPGDVLRRVWDGTGPFPKTYRVVVGADGRRTVKRCLVEGDDESERFSAAYERQLAIVEELLAEGQAAYLAGAQHHAGWTLKAVDVVLARVKLALAIFETGRDDWKAELATPRPEYEPRYSIASDKPVGW